MSITQYEPTVTLSKFHYGVDCGRRWHSNSDPYKTQQQLVEIPAPTPVVIAPYGGGHKSRMAEWSYPRKPWKQANGQRQRELRSGLNNAHNEYSTGEMSLDDFTNKMIEFLEPGNSNDDVFGFLQTIADALADQSFHRGKTSFALHLKKSFENYQQDTTEQPTEQDALPSTDEAPADEEREGTDTLASVGHRRNKKGILTAYQNLMDNKPHAGDELFKVVTAFAKSKISSGRGLWNLEEVAATADDHAQEVALSVLRQLRQGNFKGGPEQFFHWVNDICCNVRKKAFTETKEYTSLRVPVLVELEGEDGKPYIEDNPLIRPRDYPIEHRRVLPGFIQGLDLKICNYIREDYTYAKIARVLSMKVSAVKMRADRMAKKIQEMKAQGLL